MVKMIDNYTLVQVIG